MKQKKKLIYLIPTYNEKESIIPMLKLVTKVLNKLKKYKFTILVIDDNSPDGTANLVRSYQKVNKNIKLITGNKDGLGAAMIRGYKHSINKLKADIIVSNEADFSYDPALTIPMIKFIEKGFDMVITKRKLSKKRKWSNTRKIIHWFANDFFSKTVAGINEVEDHDSAFRAIRVEGILTKLNFDDFPQGFSFFNYLIFKVLQLTSKVKELEGIYTPRVLGESKISLKPKYIKYFIKDSLEYVFNCFKIRLEKIST